MTSKDNITETSEVEKSSFEVSIEDITKYFELCCDLLPLGNWRVEFVLANSHDMSHYIDSPDAYGCCIKNRNMMNATVYLNVDKSRVDEMGETWEYTVVHELLHLVLDDFIEYVEMKYPDSYEDPFFQTKLERLINLLSYALCNALELNVSLENNNSNTKEITSDSEVKCTNLTIQKTSKK